MSRKSHRQHPAATTRPTTTPTPVVIGSPTDDAAPPRPSEEDIRTLAYFKWEQAGCPNGDGCEFWFAAENALMANGPAR